MIKHDVNGLIKHDEIMVHELFLKVLVQNFQLIVDMLNLFGD